MPDAFACWAMISGQDQKSERMKPGGKPRRTGSLLFRLTVPSLVAVFSLWVGYTGYWAEKYETDLRADFEQNGARATQLFSGAVADALWEFDRRSAEATLAGLSEWPDFASVVILDQTGEFAVYQHTDRAVPDLGRDVATTEGDWPVRADDFAFFSARVVHPEYGFLGRIIAAFDERPLDEAIWMARRNAMLAAVIGFALLGFLLTQVARSVIRPLVRITEAVERVAAGDLDHRVPDAGTSVEVRRLAKALEVFRRNAGRLVEIRSEAEANRRVARLAMLDDLTQLANRRAMTERFDRIDAAPDESGDLAYSIAHIDLDGFKQINDNLGHGVGDDIIRGVARRQLRYSDRCDLIARIGGDEFVLLMRHAPDARAPEDVARAIVTDLGRPFVEDDHELRIGASVGIAHHVPGHGRMSDTLVNADIALYRAKAQGKGRVVTFNETHRQEIKARKQASDDITHGIDNGLFVPHFQGIFEAGTHRLVSVEMLTRWHHPTRGLLAPAAFLELANDLNLMPIIDRQVFRQALDLFEAWAAEGIELPRLCINLSVARLVETDFVDMLARARAAGISMEVELLESIYLDEPSPQLLRHIDRIRDLGAGLNIDDFGTGHASVAGLVQIRPDKVKIDRRFVIPLLENTRSRKLVETLLGICALMDIASVAEGVETLEHAHLLHELGCHYLQGHALMRPIPARDLYLRLTWSDTAVGL